MFEKEAEEIANKRCHEIMCYGHCSFSSPKHHRCGEWHREYNCAKEGIEFGYNKANEWHYLSKGEYPKEYEDIMICFLTKDDMKDCVRGWYEYDYENNKHIFKYLNVLGTQYLETVYAWKEIVLPKESE